VAAAVVSGWEDGEELTSCESFKSIHYTLVRSQNKFNFVIIQEKFNAIWAEFHDVSCAVRVSNKVGLDTKLRIAISRVWPQYIDNELLLKGRNLVDHF